MKIRYTGTKSKNDSIVKLHWEPGEVKDVTPQLASLLLPFPDTWVEVKGDVLGKGATGKKAVAEPEVPKENLIDVEPPPKVEHQLPVVNFDSMKQEDLVLFIRQNYNVDLDVNMPLQEIRQNAQEIFSRKENELIDEAEYQESVKEEAKNKDGESEVLKAVRESKKG